jgi:hypothetical protein
LPTTAHPSVLELTPLTRLNEEDTLLTPSPWSYILTVALFTAPITALASPPMRVIDTLKDWIYKMETHVVSRERQVGGLAATLCEGQKERI